MLTRSCVIAGVRVGLFGMIGLVGVAAAHALPPGTYVGKIDGTGLRRIAGPTRPCWLPSGQQLLLLVENRCYQIDRDGAGKRLLYRDLKVGALAAAWPSPSGRYVAVLEGNWTDFCRQGPVLTVLRLSDGQAMHTAGVSGPDCWFDEMLTDSFLDWHPEADLLAYVVPSGGVAVYSPDTGHVSRVAQALVPGAVAWHREGRALFVFSGGAVFRVPLTGATGEEVWVRRLPMTGLPYAHLADFECIRGGEVFYCAPLESEQPTGFVTREGDFLNRWVGTEGGSLEWISGERFVLAQWVGNNAPVNEGNGRTRVVRLLRGALGRPELTVAAEFDVGVEPAESRVEVSPDGTLVALEVGPPAG